jgi:arylsulfatase A-like enzyme
VPPTYFKPATLPPGTLKDERFHRGADEEQRRHLYEGYLACVSHMDEQLGRVLDALDANGFRDETLVVFVADHGYHIGEQGQWDKLMLLDPSLHVPLILAGPGMPGGRVCPAVVESIDLFPTVCSLMGWASEQSTPATDLSPWIADPARPSERPAFAWVSVSPREGWTLRTATHRYGLMRSSNGPLQPFLFDLEKDPHESNNLAGAEPQTMENELRRQLEQHFQLPS